MERDGDEIALLASLPTEAEASLLAARLGGDGIEAWVEGGIASGFRAEAPGNARVVVRRRDLERAAELLGRDQPAPVPKSPPAPWETSGGSSRRVFWMIVAIIFAALILVGVVSL